MNHRIEMLKRMSMETSPSISLERARLYREAYIQYEGKVSTPELRALSFKHYMSHRQLSIENGELIVGEKGPALQTAPTFPELCCHTVQDMEIMSKRKMIPFRVDASDFKTQEDEIIPFWSGRAMRDMMLDRMSDEWRDCYEAGIFTEFMEQRAPGHTVGDDKIFVLGFDDLIEKIDKSLAQYSETDKVSELKGMKIAIEGLYVYADRYQKLLYEKVSVESDVARREELKEMADNFNVIPRNKPKTFHQALQMYWLVHIAVTSELNNWDAYSPGRLDQHLAPFYNESISREKAKELLQCLWIKFNNQPAPPKVGVTLKESGTYTDFANINTGGLTRDGKDGVNEVSYLILEVMDEMKLTQPSSNVQISDQTPDRFLLKAAEISRKGWGQPAFYNSQALVREMLNAGKAIEDAYQGGASGCVETGAFGKEAYILTGYLNLPKILEIALNDGMDPMTGKVIGCKTTFGSSYDLFYQAFEKQLNHFIEIKIRGNEIIEKLYAEKMPAPLLSVLTTGCVESGTDYNAGGAKYNTRYIQGVGIGSVTDAMVSIKHNVFELNRFTVDELKDALRSDYRHSPEILNWVRNHTPKYGNDDDRADETMKRIFDSFYQAVTGRRSICGFTYRINMLPTTCHVYFGEVLGASAEGRLSGKPVSEGISPSKGADLHGPTAVACSATKMPHEKTGGTLLNQKFLPSSISGESGLELFAAYIRAYFKMGGHHVQFNVIDRETLMKAQNDPESYKGLIVRVAGYSDYFNNLSPVLQQEIMDRTEQIMN